MQWLNGRKAHNKLPKTHFAKVERTKEMKMRKDLFKILICIFLAVMFGCQSMLAPKIGMDRNEWLRTTLIADQVGLQGDWEVWRSGGKFYYFKNGKLDHIDQGQLMEKRFRIDVRHKIE